MTTMYALSTVVERLRYRFTEDSIYEQLITADVKNLLDKLWWLRNVDEARCMYAELEHFWECVRQLDKILHRIEDLVESHKVGVTSRDKVCTMRSIFKRMSGRVPNRKLIAEFNSLINRINGFLVPIENYLELVESREQSPGSSSSRDGVGGPGRPWTSSLVEERWDGGQIIRKERDEENLVSDLTGGSRGVEFVAICGMGGIGKTTLARTLYNNPKVKKHFDVRAWVTVTNEFRTRDNFLSIVSQIGPLDSDLFARTDNVDLAEDVKKRLKALKWLVVLDDVRSIEAWESIKLAFPEDNNDSRILVTTRNRDVAVSMSRGARIHSMRFLDEDQGWELFKRGAHLPDSGLYSKKEYIAKMIVSLCPLPLAIIMLAHILKSRSFDELKSLLQESEVDINEINGREALTRALDMNYNCLPSVLKPCLLYLGTFPEGSKIEADTMCQLWIAEGLVSEEECELLDATTMELAGTYFYELALRNLVQVPEEEMLTDRSFRHVYLHDLIRDICILKAKEEEFFEIVKLGHANQPEASGFRCAIYLDRHGEMDILPYLRFDLRSLLFFNSYNQSGEDLNGQWAIPDLSNLKWLRILHFDGVDFRCRTLPPGVENLLLLRHLSLRDCYLKNLPPYIGNFFFLITLDLRVKKGCKVIIPNVLCKLQKLRHLYLPLEFQTPNHEYLQLNSLINLEILENFVTGICNAEISMLTRLRHLVVISEGNFEDLKQIYECIERNEKHLSKTTLDIRNYDSYSEERSTFIGKLFSCRVLHILRLEGRIGKIPRLDAAHKSFTKIHLNGSELEDDPMQTLEGLPHLRILVLETEAYIGKEMYCSDFGFPELRSLKLSKLYNLDSWKLGVKAMPKLSTLTIENCRRMKKLPEKLGYIKALRKLKINMMSKEFVGGLQKVDGPLNKINTNCTIEFGSDNPWLESTDSTREQNNSFQGEITEFQISSSTGTQDFASSSACPPPNE